MNPRIIIKAIKIKIALNRLSRAKENAIRMHRGLPPLRPWYRKCYISCMTSVRRACCRVFCPCCVYDGPRPVPTTCLGRLVTPRTYENDVLRNVLGFILGILTILAIFFVMVFQWKFQAITASIAIAVIGVIVTNGMAFSPGVRCVTFLTFPQFFSSTGRYFLLMYVMILVMSHPVKNFNHNIMVMSDSSTCGQQMAYNQTKEMVDAAVAPIAGVIERVRTVLKSLKNFALSLERTFMTLKRSVEEIAAAVGRVFSWLKSIVNICNEKMGSPFRKCMAGFNNAERTCRDSLGWFLEWICGILTGIKHICYILRITDLLCEITSIIKNLIMDKLAQPVGDAIESVKSMFYFNISIHYSYKFNMTQSKSFSQIRKDIMEEVKKRVGTNDILMDIVEYFMMCSIAFVLIKALIYRRQYLSSDKYDNMYLTLQLQSIDERRGELEREGILPLKSKERGKYIKSGSIALASSEKSKLIKGIVMLILNLIYAGFYLMCDYSLYWLLSLLRRQLEVKTHAAVPPHLKIHVQGDGAMADMYRAMVGFFDPLVGDNVDVDTASCLPNPSPPNWAIYKQIGIMFGIYLFLTLFEAYGLRLRHIIAACYYPKRERKRAAWLYSHILKSRGGFHVLTRRNMKRRNIKNKEIAKFSIRARLAARCALAGRLFKFLGWDGKSCICCAKEGKKEDVENFHHCVNYGCEAVYCTDCFADLNNLCTICMNPVDYGDFSDFSEERDSSADEEDVARMKEISLKRRADIQRLQEERRPSNIMGQFIDQLHITQEDVEQGAYLSQTSEDSEDVVLFDTNAQSDNDSKETVQFDSYPQTNEARYYDTTGDFYHQPQTTGDLYHQPQTNGDLYHQTQTNGDMYHEVQTTSDLYHQTQTTGDLYHPPQTTGDLYHQPQTNGDLYHQPQTNSDLYHPPQTNGDLYHQPQTNGDLYHQPQTNSDLYHPPQTNGDLYHQPQTNGDLYHQTPNNR